MIKNSNTLFVNHNPFSSLQLVRMLWAVLLLLANERPTQAATTPNKLPGGPQNLGFEEGDLGQVPPGWFVPAPIIAAGYKAKLTEENPQSGKRCVVVSREPSDEAPKIFGNLMQSFDATPFRGQRIRFRAAVRFEAQAPTDHAQLWLRVDRPGQKLGFFDNMEDRPISSESWNFYEISGTVEEDAQYIAIGMMLFGNGKASLDSVSFETLGKANISWEKPRPLSERALQNLVAYTKLLGYVRHFHPSDGAIATDWDTFAVLGVKTVEDAADASELARKLESFFRPIAPTVRVFVTGQPPAVPADLSPPAGKPEVVAWRHYGFGGGSGPKGMNIYSSERIHEPAPEGKVPAKLPDPRKPFQADLGGGVSCLVPIGLYSDDDGTFPRGKPDLDYPKLKGNELSGNDRATRLADVALAWNVFQHFYPYFDVVQTDWPAALRQALTAAATDPDDRAFLDTLRRLVADLHDGHGRAMHRSDTDFAAPPLNLAWAENQLVVTRATGAAADKLKPGDVLLKVDGKPGKDLLLEREKLISAATPQWKRWRSVTELLLGAQDSTVALEAQRGSEPPFTLSPKRSAQGLAGEKRPKKIHEAKPGIWYVDLDASQATVKDFQAALPDLEEAKGIIFDLRGYPNEVAMKVLPLLTDKPITSAQWNVPIITSPDRQKWEFKLDRWPPFGPDSPRLKAKIAFLTDGRAISYAESILGIVEYYKLGEIVGEPTAGTNGNVNPVNLPGGYSLMWTGMKVLKHKGSTHHGVGIRPTVPVSRTLEGIKAQRDELLEKAIEVVVSGQ